MGQVMFLGSGYAVPDESHDNTHILIREEGRTVLIDVASNPIQRLRRAGVAFDDLTDLILTHFHPDHVSGVPLLLMSMWLLGRKHNLDVYGLKYTIDRVKKMLDLYDLLSWPNFFPIQFHEVAETEYAPVIDTPDIKIVSSPVVHYIPTMGLRIEFPRHKTKVAYSCDTEPCEQVVRLGQGVDALIHEATGVTRGHSSSEQAAEIATKAGARALYLIHYSSELKEVTNLVEKAQMKFEGPIILAQDFMTLNFE